MSEQPEPLPAKMNHLRVFAEWHREARTWHAIYTQAVATLLAALVIYLVGAAGGVFSRQPLRVILAVIQLLALAGSLVYLGFLGRWVYRWKRTPVGEATRAEKRAIILLSLPWAACLAVATVCALLLQEPQ